MNKYFVLEENLPRLEKKINTIKNKCKKHGVYFMYKQTGEVDFREITREDGSTVINKFVAVEAFGEVRHNDWEFVGVVEHKEAGNVIRQLKTDIEVPVRYRNTRKICEHCNTIRNRKDTYLVHNVSTDEWKQVGKSCLCEFTHGLSAEEVAAYISCFDAVIQGESFTAGCSYTHYYDVKEILSYGVETVNHFGYEKKSEFSHRPTAGRALDYYYLDTGRLSTLPEYKEQLISEMHSVRFDATKESVVSFADEAIAWASSLTDKDVNCNSYLHNLKVICSSPYCSGRDLGILISLVPTYMRQIEAEIKKTEREKAREVEKSSEYVGSVGQRITFDAQTAACVYSGENMFGITFMYKFTDVNGNILMWSTDRGLDLDKKLTITGTVKKYEDFRGVKQTWLTRCKVAEREEVA